MTDNQYNGTTDAPNQRPPYNTATNAVVQQNHEALKYLQEQLKEAAEAAEYHAMRRDDISQAMEALRKSLGILEGGKAVSSEPRLG